VPPSTRASLSRLGLTALGAALVGVLSACSASSGGGSVSTGSPATPAATSTASPTTGTNTTLDSCSVVTQAEVESAFGGPVQAGVRGKATVEGGVACVYYGPGVAPGTNPDVAIANSVRVVLVTGSDATTWFNDYRGKVPAVALPGLGDQAYWDGSASVSVLKGTSYLRVAVVPVTGPSESAEKQLVTAALARM
jgi:hypothetical protein